MLLLHIVLLLIQLFPLLGFLSLFEHTNTTRQTNNVWKIENNESKILNKYYL